MGGKCVNTIQEWAPEYPAGDEGIIECKLPINYVWPEYRHTTFIRTCNVPRLDVVIVVNALRIRPDAIVGYIFYTPSHVNSDDFFEYKRSCDPSARQ